MARLSPNAQSQVQVDDGYLIALAKQGDHTSYERLVRRYYGFVRLKASSYFLAGGDSDDALRRTNPWMAADEPLVRRWVALLGQRDEIAIIDLDLRLSVGGARPRALPSFPARTRSARERDRLVLVAHSPPLAPCIRHGY